MTQMELLRKYGHEEVGKSILENIADYLLDHPDYVWEKSEDEIRDEIETFYSNFIEEGFSDEEEEKIYKAFMKVLWWIDGYKIAANIQYEVSKAAAEYEEFCREREREYLSMV